MTQGRRPLRVLLLEDSELDAELVLQRLDDAGYDVDHVREQSADGMRAALARPWDVIISDFHMPSFDAFAALDVARETGFDVPLIIVSGTIGEDIAVEAMRSGAHDYFLKGHLTRLPAAIARAITDAGHRRAQAAMRQALDALRDVAFAAGGMPEPERLAAFAADRARELLGAEGASVLQWDAAAGVLVPLATRDETLDERLPALMPGDSVSGTAFSRREGIIVDDLLAPPDGVRPAITGQGGSMIAVPLVVGDRTIGTFAVRSTVPGRFAGDHLRTLTLLAAHVAPVIELARLVEELRHRATHDPLTGLPNRQLVRQELDGLLGGRAGARPLALLCIDLEQFKAINDALGYQTGDGVLRHVGAVLRIEAPAEAVVGHLGGDKFAVAVPGAGASDAERVADRMARALEEPFESDGQSLVVGSNIGIALAPDHATSAEDLLRLGDIAMHAAKRMGAAFSTYEQRHEVHRPEDVHLMGELRGAIERGELWLHYQPQVELQRLRTIGYEVLVRWRHPTRGVLAPDRFVPLAERMGLARALFEWSLRTALREAATAGLPSDQSLAVNLSMRNLLDPDLPRLVENALAGSGRGAATLVFEITERVVMADPDRVLRVLERLRGVGVRLSIDDFGTGYSSMAYLQRLPVDELKIDRTFLAGIPADRRNVSIVRATIDLARGLGIAALAEGVEDQGTLAALVTLGCDRGQGFYFGHPAPIALVRRSMTAA